MVGNAKTLEMIRKIVRRNKKALKEFEMRFGEEPEDDEVRKTFGETGEVGMIDSWATDPRDAAYLAQIGVEEI